MTPAGSVLAVMAVVRLWRAVLVGMAGMAVCCWAVAAMVVSVVLPPVAARAVTRVCCPGWVTADGAVPAELHGVAGLATGLLLGAQLVVAVELERLFDGDDGSINPGAVAARGREEDTLGDLGHDLHCTWAGPG